MEILPYQPGRDQKKLHEIMLLEGDEWSDYSSDAGFALYGPALKTSITYVARDGDKLCGYSRSINDNGLSLYVLDLLVKPVYRGQGLGRQLMECLFDDYPGMTVYVTSDVDPYYSKLGYRREGTVFQVISKRP